MRRNYVAGSGVGMFAGRTGKAARHSRTSGNPVWCSWIPGLALLARNDEAGNSLRISCAVYLGCQRRQSRTYPPQLSCRLVIHRGGGWLPLAALDEIFSAYIFHLS